MALNPNMKRVQVDLPKKVLPDLNRVKQRLNEESEGPVVTTAAMLRRWVLDGLSRELRRK